MAQHSHFIEKTAHNFDIKTVSEVLHEQLIKTIEEQGIDPGEKWTDAKVPVQELVGETPAAGADKQRLTALVERINSRVNNRQWNQKAYHKFLKFFKKRTPQDFVDLALIPAQAFGPLADGAIKPFTTLVAGGATGAKAPTDAASAGAKKAWALGEQLGTFTLDLMLYTHSEAGAPVTEAGEKMTGYPSLKKKIRGGSINAVLKELIEDGETHIKRSARQLGAAAESFSILREWEQVVAKGTEDGATWKRSGVEGDPPEKDPWKFVNCDEAITMGFLACNFLHHYDKLRAESWEVFKFVNFLSSRIGEWNKLWDQMRDTAPVATHLHSANHDHCGSLCYGPKKNAASTPRKPLSSWTIWETNLGIKRSQVKNQEQANLEEVEQSQVDKLKEKEAAVTALEIARLQKRAAHDAIGTFDQDKLDLEEKRNDLEARKAAIEAGPRPTDSDEERLFPFKLEYLDDQIAKVDSALANFTDEARQTLSETFNERKTKAEQLQADLEQINQQLAVIASMLEAEPESKKAKATSATYHAKGSPPKAFTARVKRFKNWFSVSGIQNPANDRDQLRVRGAKGKAKVNAAAVKGDKDLEFKGELLKHVAGDETPARRSRLLTLLNDIYWPIENKSTGHRFRRKWGRWSMFREHKGRKALRFTFMALGSVAGVVIIITTGGAAAPVIGVGIGAALWSADKLSGDKLDRRFAKGSQEKLEALVNGAGEQPGEILADVSIQAHQGAKATLKRGAAVRRQFASCEKNFQRMLYFSHKRVHPRDPSRQLGPFEFADCEDAASFLWAAAKFRRHYCKLVHYITPITLYSGTLLQAMGAMEHYWWGEKGYQDITTKDEDITSFDGKTASDPPENMREVVMGAIKKVVFEDKAWHDAHCGTTPKDRSDRTFRIRRRWHNQIKNPYPNQRSAMCYGPVQSNAADDSGITFKNKLKIRRRLSLGHTLRADTTNLASSGKGAVPKLLSWAWGHGWTEFLKENLALDGRAGEAEDYNVDDLVAAIEAVEGLQEDPLDDVVVADGADPEEPEEAGGGDEEVVEGDVAIDEVAELDYEEGDAPPPPDAEDPFAEMDADQLHQVVQGLIVGLNAGLDAEADPEAEQIVLQPAEYEFLVQPHNGQYKDLCAYFSLYHFHDGGMTEDEFFDHAVGYRMDGPEEFTEADAKADAWHGNDPAILLHAGLQLLPEEGDRLAGKDVAIVAQLPIDGNRAHFYCIRKIEGVWWSFDSYNLPEQTPIQGDVYASIQAGAQLWG